MNGPSPSPAPDHPPLAHTASVPFSFSALLLISSRAFFFPVAFSVLSRKLFFFLLSLEVRRYRLRVLFKGKKNGTKLRNQPKRKPKAKKKTDNASLCRPRRRHPFTGCVPSEPVGLMGLAPSGPFGPARLFCRAGGPDSALFYKTFEAESPSSVGSALMASSVESQQKGDAGGACFASFFLCFWSVTSSQNALWPVYVLRFSSGTPLAPLMLRNPAHPASGLLRRGLASDGFQHVFRSLGSLTRTSSDLGGKSLQPVNSPASALGLTYLFQG